MFGIVGTIPTYPTINIISGEASTSTQVTSTYYNNFPTDCDVAVYGSTVALFPVEITLCAAPFLSLTLKKIW